MTESQKPSDSDIRLKESEVAKRLQVSTATVQCWRRKNKGPNYIKLLNGTIRYRLEDVLSYEERCLVVTKNN